MALAVLGAGMVLYSQTSAFTGDEGFHLLAAQLIDSGKRPYLDFFFPQTSLNAYWNAGWMRIFGQSWRVPHAVSAIGVTAAIALAAHFVYTRMPIPKWRSAGALAVVIAAGLNVALVEYGPLAQAYGTCLLLTVAAFRFAIASPDRQSPLPAFGAAICASAAAASSLLSAPAALVLLVWILIYNRAGSRLSKLGAFVAGAAIPFVPMFLLFLQSPRNVLFNLFEYHLHYRKLYWPETTQHDLEVMTDWIDSGQTLLLGLLAIGGVLFIRYRGKWDREVRAEFYLCAWIALGISMELATAHPTFSRYFVLIVPFAAILAAVGLYAAAAGLYDADRPALPLALVAVLFTLGLGKSLYQRSHDVHTWPEYEEMARKVEQVTPPDASLFADEEIYFLLRRTPPSGLEFNYSHRLNLPPALAAQLHIISDAQLTRMFADGAFDTAFTCDEDQANDLQLRLRYARKIDVNDCTVFWGRRR